MKLIETQKFLKRFELDEFPQPEIVRMRYPVLLCHGYGALASIIKPSPLHEVCMQLRKHGVIVFAPNIVPYAKIETRAAQWVKKVEKLSKQYGFEKFNVIAHSMSGLDMRYAIAQTDVHKKIASLTTLAAPHYGTSLAELVLSAPDKVRDKLGEYFDWLGESMYPKSKSDAVGAVRQLSLDYVQNRFNPDNPDHDQVAYFSYSAAVGKGTEQPLNRIYRFQNNYLYEHEGPNDIFVSEKSARWGRHIACVPLSHLEQIKIGLNKERLKIFESFWYNAARRLRDDGF